MNKLKLEAVISSVIIYLIIVAVIFIIIMYAPTKHKAKVYTEKNSHVIEVSLGSPLSEQTHGVQKANKNKKKQKHKKPTKKRVKKKKEKSKPVKKIRNTKKEKKPTRKSIIKTTKPKKSKQVKQSRKADTSKLFKNLTSKIKDDTTSSQSAGVSGKSLKKVNKNPGIENRYFANVQNKLKGWPAQSNFIGEKISVELTIYSSGLFSYKILHRSINPEFNNALKSYLEQLKRFGFGPHSNPKPYDIIVDFIAKG